MKNTHNLFDGLKDKLCSMVRGKMRAMTKMSSSIICKTTDILILIFIITLQYLPIILNDLFRE